MTQKKCKHLDCRKPFTPVNWFQRFCSDACRKRDHRAKQQKKKQAAK